MRTKLKYQNLWGKGREAGMPMRAQHTDYQWMTKATGGNDACQGDDAS